MNLCLFVEDVKFHLVSSRHLDKNTWFSIIRMLYSYCQIVKLDNNHPDPDRDAGLHSFSLLVFVTRAAEGSINTNSCLANNCFSIVA